MPRSCSICSHPQRERIDRALVAGEEPFRNIAERFGTSVAALHRHKGEHLPAALARAREAEEVAHADGLLCEVRALQARTLAILEAAENTGQLRTALSAIGEARRNLELLGRLAGELSDSSGATVNVLVSPQWIEIRTAIVEVLDPYPEAKSAVARSLLQIEREAS